MIEIELTQGQVTYVDNIDADLAELKWHAAFKPRYTGGGKFIAARKYPRSSGKKGSEGLHQAIMAKMLERELEKGEWVDHVNRNPLDNRRSNLRLATPAQNGANRGKTAMNTSGYKGVTFKTRRNHYEASIERNGKSIHLGTFDDPVEAAKIYDFAARDLHGEFAVLNFPD